MSFNTFSNLLFSKARQVGREVKTTIVSTVSLICLLFSYALVMAQLRLLRRSANGADENLREHESRLASLKSQLSSQEKHKWIRSAIGLGVVVLMLTLTARSGPAGLEIKQSQERAVLFADTNTAIPPDNRISTNASSERSVPLAKSTGPVLDFEAEIKKAGFSGVSPIDTYHFAVFGTFEEFKVRANTRADLLGDTKPEIKSAVYSITVPIGTDEIGWRMFGMDHKSRFVAAHIPFRLEFNPRKVACSGKMFRVAPFLADHNNVWFLTKNGTIRRCNSLDEIDVVARNNGILYLAESVLTSSVMIETMYENAFQFVTDDKPRARIEFDSLGAHKPYPWGFYKVKALASEVDRYDCSAILRAYSVGLTFGNDPAYFATDEETPDKVVTARLRRIELIGNDGRVLGGAKIAE